MIIWSRRFLFDKWIAIYYPYSNLACFPVYIWESAQFVKQKMQQNYSCNDFGMDSFFISLNFNITDKNACVSIFYTSCTFVLRLNSLNIDPSVLIGNAQLPKMLWKINSQVHEDTVVYIWQCIMTFSWIRMN